MKAPLPLSSIIASGSIRDDGNLGISQLPHGARGPARPYYVYPSIKTAGELLRHDVYSFRLPDPRVWLTNQFTSHSLIIHL